MFLISNLRIKKFPIDEIKPDGWPVQLPSLSGRQAFPIIEESILSQTLTDPCHRVLRGELLLQPLFCHVARPMGDGCETDRKAAPASTTTRITHCSGGNQNALAAQRFAATPEFCPLWKLVTVTMCIFCSAPQDMRDGYVMHGLQTNNFNSKC